ncbi:MAG: hemin uptake protein HemP [Rhodospirillales bacterium]|nr:hemin uptake protein HemP [Rhodospirillales bacterium]
MQETKTLSTFTQLLPQPVKEISSLALFGNARELLIRHSGELYRLRPTAKGGLILTK